MYVSIILSYAYHSGLISNQFLHVLKMRMNVVENLQNLISVMKSWKQSYKDKNTKGHKRINHFLYPRCQVSIRGAEAVDLNAASAKTRLF